MVVCTKVSVKKKHPSVLLEVTGWYGVAAIIAAYFLLSFGFLDLKASGYQVLNLTGSLAILLHSYVKRDFQPVALNAIWLIIAGIALFRIWS
jgi:membrane-bound ClpP family serine protease